MIYEEDSMAQERNQHVFLDEDILFRDSNPQWPSGSTRAPREKALGKKRKR
jgi:hypothetical protein